jgi:hypothetical protein
MNVRFANLITACAALLLLIGGAEAADSPSSAGPRASSSVAPQAIPPGHVRRYAIPHYYSVISGGGRSLTIVTVRNGSGASCEVYVNFQKGQAITNTCTLIATIPGGQGRAFCSRQPGSFGAISCNLVCSPQLTFDQGQAGITSTNSALCDRIQIDAEVIYTSSPTDDVVTGLTRLSVVKAGAASVGD